MFKKIISKKWIKRAAELEGDCDCTVVSPEFFKELTKKKKLKKNKNKRQ